VSQPPFRSVTHGTCALDGDHTSEEYAAECPLLGRNPQERLERFRASRQGVDSGSQKSVAPAPESSSTSNTVFRDGRAGKSGRPPVPQVAQRQKARDRARAYRERERQSFASSGQAVV